MTEQMESRHPNLFWCVSEADLMVTDLNAKTPFLTDEQIIVEFARIVAIADAHSHLSLYQSAASFTVYPLRFYFFQDGLFIVDAEDTSLIGAQVTSINDHSIEDGYNRIAPIITHDNRQVMLNLVSSYLVGPQLLHALGLIDDINLPDQNFHEQR